MRLRTFVFLLVWILMALPSILVAQNWTVPQIGATSFDPVHIEFHAKDPNLVLVLNSNGRVDILNIRNPLQPEKQGEILAGAVSAGFNPTGKSVVTGGVDGVIRLWDFQGNLITQFDGLSGPVNSLAFSPDGTRILSGGNYDDGGLYLWDLHGNLITQFDGLEGEVYSVAFSPDGTRVLSGGGTSASHQGELLLWDLEGNLVAKMDGLEGPVSSVAFGLDGTRILSNGVKLRLWDLQGNLITEFDGLERPVSSVAFNPDGTRVLSGGGYYDSELYLWDFEGNLIAEFKGLEGELNSVAFSPEGTRILSGSRGAGGAYGELGFWDLRGSQIASFEIFDEPVNSVAFSPDGNLILSGNYSGPILLDLQGNQIAEFDDIGQGEIGYQFGSFAFSPDGTLILGDGPSGPTLWDIQGDLIAEFDGLDGRLTSVAFGPDGDRILSGSGGFAVGELHLWDLQGNLITEFGGLERPVNSVAFSPDGTRVLSGGGGFEDGELYLWDLAGNLITEFEGLEGTVSSVAFSPDGTRVLSGGNSGVGNQGELLLWDLEGNLIEKFGGRFQPVRSVAFSPDGTRILSGGGYADGELFLWDLEGNLIAEFSGGHLPVRSVAFSPDGTRILSGGNSSHVVGDLVLWSIQGHLIAKSNGFRKRLTSVAFSPDGTRILSGNSDGEARLWGLQGNQSSAFDRLAGPVNGVALSYDGTQVLSGGGNGDAARGSLLLWDLQGTQVAEFEVGFGAVNSVAINPDGTLILAGGDPYFDVGALFLWDIQGNLITEFGGHDESVNNVVFSPDGTWILSGGGGFSSGGDLRLWDLKGNLITEFDGLENRVESVAFSPDGSQILSGGGSGVGSELRLWDLKGNLIREFDGLEGWLRGVDFSQDGTFILSQGERELRITNIDGDLIAKRPVCELQTSMFLRRDGKDPRRIAALCEDRLIYFDYDLSVVGQIFLIEGDGMSLIQEEGVSSYNGAPYRLFSTFEEIENALGSGAGIEIFGRPLAAGVSENRLRQVLLNDWNWIEKIYAMAAAWKNSAKDLYSNYVKGWTVAPFVVAVVILCTWMVSLLTWFLVPAQMFQWMLPSTTASEYVPLPRQVINGFLVFQWLARTSRPRRAWFRKHRGALEAACFTNRTPVKERERYADVALANEWDDPSSQFRRRGRLIAWVHGEGGTGKTAYACNFARRHLVGNCKSPMPIFIDEDWSGELAQHVSSAMRLPEWKRGLTPQLVKKLGEDGLICPIVDSLSERSDETALEEVTRCLNESNFRHGLVTSREAPSGAFWEDKLVAQTRALSTEDVPKFVKRYVDDEAKHDVVQRRLVPMTATSPMPKPLFLRFAIEQAEKRELESAERTDLVLKYVEASRKDDISKQDFARAASVAAAAAMHGQSHGPKELSFEYLRGVFQSAATNRPFMSGTGDKKVTPTMLIDYLVSSGILSRNRVNSRVQFTHDPVAEYLAAWEVAENSAGDEQVRTRLIEPFQNSQIPELYREIEAYKKTLRALG